jgi:hypothetical protein
MYRLPFPVLLLRLLHLWRSVEESGEQVAIFLFEEKPQVVRRDEMMRAMDHSRLLNLKVGINGHFTSGAAI